MLRPAPWRDPPSRRDPPTGYQQARRALDDTNSAAWSLARRPARSGIEGVDPSPPARRPARRPSGALPADLSCSWLLGVAGSLALGDGNGVLGVGTQRSLRLPALLSAVVLQVRPERAPAGHRGRRRRRSAGRSSHFARRRGHSRWSSDGSWRSRVSAARARPPPAPCGPMPGLVPTSSRRCGRRARAAGGTDRRARREGPPLRSIR